MFFSIQVHVVIDCPHLAPYRNSCGIGPFVRVFKRAIPEISSIKLYALFLDDKEPHRIKTKAMDLYSMKVGWHVLMNIDL